MKPGHLFMKGKKQDVETGQYLKNFESIYFENPPAQSLVITLKSVSSQSSCNICVCVCACLS